MRKKLKLSVVMAVYNGETYLREAIDSILNQTFTNFEFIIINDGSTDGTQQILESYKDPRIIPVHQEHLGFTKSLNNGIALAKGEYIARQDADDISMPDRLEKQIEFLERHKNIALLGTATKFVDEKGRYLYTIEFSCDHFAIERGMNRQNHFIHGSVMFKKQYFFELGGYRDFFLTSQDFDLWLRFIENYEVANLSNPLYKRRITSHSITLKNIVLQRRMGRFAKLLAKAREKGISENSLIKDLKTFLESRLSVTEKELIFRNHYHLSKLLLLNNKNEAFLVLEKGIKYHPSKLYKLLFKITKIFQSSFLLEMLIRIWTLVHWLKKKTTQSRTISVYIDTT